MNVLLVYPKYPDTFWSFKSVLKYISKKAAFPPLGLLTVASLLPKTWVLKLVDVNVLELSDDSIAWADMVFISAMIVQMDSAREIIRRSKKQGKTVVMGGPAATTLPEQFAGVDYFVLNEAEITLPQFLADLEQGHPKPIYTSMERPDIKKTPIPQWSLINMKDYAIMPVQYSRGCPYDCEFCDIVVMNGHKPRLKTPGQLVGEIDSLYKAGWRGDIFIVDDNFIGNKTRVKKMLPALIAWQKKHKYPYVLTTEASTDLAGDEQLMQLMSAANFHKVFLGIETPNIDSLKECGKYQNTSQSLEEAVRKLQSKGMQVMGGFIVGFDNDTDSIFEAQIKFIQKVGVVTAMVGLLNVLPQTRLWHRLKAEGRLLEQTSGENTDAQLNYIPKMTRENLVEGYQKILATIYSPKEYYARINTFIKNFRPRAKNRIRFAEYKAAIRSVWSIGVRSPSRFLFWGLMARTSLTKISALPIAVEMAIYGLHFQKISERIVGS